MNTHSLNFLTHSDPPLQGDTLKGSFLKLIFCHFIFLVMAVHPVFAADLTVTCGNTSCTKDSATSLFTSSTVWYPGLSESHTVHVDNTAGAPRDISTYPTISEEVPGNLDTVMQLGIFLSGNAVPLWLGSLHDFFQYTNTHPLPLTQVGAQTHLEYIYSVTMDASAGNEYQNTKTTFDLSFQFSGEDAPTPTPSPNPSNSHTGGGSTQTSSTTNSTGTTSLIQPLLMIPQRIQQFFIPSNPIVAGAQTELETTPTPEPADDDVKGASTVLCEMCIWWPLLVLQALFLIIHFTITRQKNSRAFWRGGIYISIFTYAAFLFLNRDCRNGWQLWLSTTSFWCNYFIVWVLLLFSILSYIFKPPYEEQYEVPQNPSDEIE